MLYISVFVILTVACTALLYIAFTLIAQPSGKSVAFWFNRCIVCLQCFDAVGWVAGRAPGL